LPEKKITIVVTKFPLGAVLRTVIKQLKGSGTHFVPKDAGREIALSESN